MGKVYRRYRFDPSRYTGGSAQAFFAPSEGWGRFLREHRIVGADGRAGHIHTHQFRRTFARWCALSDSSTGLLALKDHFKHASILMTRYYARIDDELLLLFEAEKDRIRAESFDELPREFRGMAGAQLRGTCVRKWLQSGVQLRACAGHYCVPIDPHATCEEAGSFGCNKGTCRNAVFHPEHAPGLAESPNKPALDAIAFVLQALRVLKTKRVSLWSGFFADPAFKPDRRFAWDSGTIASTLLESAGPDAESVRVDCGMATDVVMSSKRFNFTLDPMALREAVELVESLLADHRVKIQEDASIKNLVALLDSFVEVGWPEALQLVWRLDEIYR